MIAPHDLPQSSSGPSPPSAADPDGEVTPGASAAETGPERPAGLVVVDIGNSCIRAGLWTDAGVSEAARLEREDGPALEKHLEHLQEASAGIELVAGVIACVVPGTLARVERAVEQALRLPLAVVGRDVPHPLEVAVTHPESLGADRACAAAAAYRHAGGACAVVDFGTAVTVDLVDDDGVFQGGAILPGARLQAEALGRNTATLPMVAIETFPIDSVGRDTAEAIRSGIGHGLVGAVRGLVEQYAGVLSRWPYVVATGGDAAWLVEHCDFVDACITDLCLQGVGIAYVRQRGGQAEDE